MGEDGGKEPACMSLPTSPPLTSVAFCNGGKERKERRRKRKEGRRGGQGAGRRKIHDSGLPVCVFSTPIYLPAHSPLTINRKEEYLHKCNYTENYLPPIYHYILSLCVLVSPLL